MTITWPITLPAAPLAEGYRETPPVTALRTDMEQGPAKLRPRTTAGTGSIEARYLLGKTQLAALDIFYRDTLAGGALSFAITHPRTGLSVLCRFVEPPAYAAVNGFAFHAVLRLEVLP